MNIDIAEIVGSPVVHAVAAYGAIVALGAVTRAAGPLKRILAEVVKTPGADAARLAIDENAAARRAVLVELRHKAAELRGGDEREAALTLLDEVDLLERKLFSPVAVLKLAPVDPTPRAA